MDESNSLNILKSIRQEHILKYWDTLIPEQKISLIKQIRELDIPTFEFQQKLVRNQPRHDLANIKPFKDYFPAGNEEDAESGFDLIREGKAGCLIVAGGQGTRLRFEGPKGMLPVSVVKKKSLFQIFAEKVKAASKQAKRPLNLAIMTSPQNDAQTRRFFKEHDDFGLDPSQLVFFCQGSLPLLDRQGNLFLEAPGLISQGPDGNGSAIYHFVHSGIWEKWHTQGIRYIHFILIDNPLADPFDAGLIGFHHRHQCQITVKCIARLNADEKLGLLVNDNATVRIIEYSEMPEAELKAINSDGSLKHFCANISLYGFNMDFIKAIADNQYRGTPMHLAFKAVKHLNAEGKQIKPENPMAWKFERFVFDILPFAKTVKALLYPRESCYAPLKNFEGDNSLATVQQGLQRNDIATIEKITGQIPTRKIFELSQDFYYPTPELLQKWKGRSIPDIEYLDANACDLFRN